MEIDEEAIITMAKELRDARPLYINTIWDRGYSMGYSFAVAVVRDALYKIYPDCNFGKFSQIVWGNKDE